MIESPAPILFKLGPSLHHNAARIEFTVLVSVIVPLVSGNLTRLTPREVVKVPECVGWEDKVPDGEGEKVDEHPADVRNLARGNDDQQTRKTKDNSQEDEGNLCGACTLDGTDDEQVDGKRDGGGKDQCTSQLHEDDELHRKAECTA